MNTPFLICKNEDMFYSLLLPVEKLACSNPELRVFLPYEDIVTITLFSENELKLHVQSGLRLGEVDFNFHQFPEGTWLLGIYGQQNGYLSEVTYNEVEIMAHSPEPSTAILLAIGLILVCIGSKFKRQQSRARA